jgi:pimeloyl-ACP methyl ester carboxylesterase
MKNVKPFKVEISQDVLDDLKTRIKMTRWTDAPDNAGWNYGTNLTYLKELADYWLHKYNWREQEKTLNQFPQFKTEIESIEIHFLHVKANIPNAKPIILTHGWPDSYYRFFKLIPLLTEQGFDVVVPSIPGFGFSDLKAVSSDKTAELFAHLMTDVLGYSTFFAAGGDMGTVVTKPMARKFPEKVKAIHLTDVGYPNGSEDWSTMSPAEQQFGQTIQRWFFTEGAFNMIQATKPQTLGYALNDSPVGLASWIIEKFNSWGDTKGNIENSFTKDELLTNIMIYWVTQTINTSIRTYAENARALYAHGYPQPEQKVEVPTAVALFPAEAQIPTEWAERMVNLKRFTKMPKGGHFAAMEEPDLLAQDMIEFFKDYSL